MSVMRCAVFIDGAYLEKLLRDEQGGIPIDLEKLSDWLMERVRGGTAEIPMAHLRSYYYHALPWEPHEGATREERDRVQNKRSFFHRIEHLNRFEVRLGRTQRFFDEACGVYRFEQKGVDVLLSVDLVSLAARGDIQYAVLLAPDGDFVPAVKAAKNSGTVIFLAAGETPPPAWELRKECDQYIPLEREEMQRLRRDRPAYGA